MNGANVREDIQTRPRGSAFRALGESKDDDALLTRHRQPLANVVTSTKDGRTLETRPRRPPVNVMAMVSKFNSQEQVSSPSDVTSPPTNTQSRLSRSASFGEISTSGSLGDDWVKLDQAEAPETPPSAALPTSKSEQQTSLKPLARRKKFNDPTDPAVGTQGAKVPMIPPRVSTVLTSTVKVNGVSENPRVPPRPPPPNLKPTRRLSPHPVRKDGVQPLQENPAPSLSGDANASSNSLHRSSTYSESSSLTDSFDDSTPYKSPGVSMAPHSPGPFPPTPSSMEGRRSELEESYDMVPEMSLKFDDVVEKVKKRDSRLQGATIYEVVQAVAREVPHCASTGELPATISAFPTEGRERIILELYTTEYKYVQQLEVIVEVYMHNLRPILVDEMSHIFNNVEDILAFNRGFLALLHRRLCDWYPQQCIGDIFIGMFNQTHKSMYAIYCSNYDNAEQRVLKVKKRKEVDDVLKQCQTVPAVIPGLTLPMYLITPVQRIPRYILLLKDVIKKTPEDHRDYPQLIQAVEKMGELASYINLQIKETQTKKTLQHLRVKVTGLSDLTHDPNRKLVKEGQVYLKNVKKLYQCILFNDLLVFALGDSRQSTVELQLPLEALWVEDLEDRDPQTSSEDALELYTPQRPYTMYVRSNSEKKLWLPKLVETIYHHLFANNKCDRSDSLATVKRYAEFVYQDQRFYTGWYVDSLCHGKGNMTWSKNQLHYVGDWVDDMRCGEGELHYNTGEKYIGKWAEDKQNGFGELHYHSGDVYKGTWKDGQRHGKARVYYSNGDLFDGQFVSGHIEGRGKLLCVNGVEYVGEWKNSHRHGQGTLKTQQGNVYAGEFRQNQIHGQGRMQYFNGDTYTGSFKSGLRQGNGRFISQREGQYDGAWEKDLRHGKGEMKYKNGDTYDGFWEYDKRHGKGTLKLKTGEHYTGEFRYGVISGKGEMVYGKGASYTGDWTNGMRDGKGRMVYSDKSEYDGEWKMDLRHGKGDYKHPAKGISYSGQWEFNLPHGDGELRIKNKTEDYQYKGQWVAGIRDGKGLEQSQYGTYEGYWRNDMKHGHGEERTTVNTIFKGQWERGRKHGSGERKLPFGLIEEQRWKSGQLLSDNQRMTAVELPFLSRSDL